MQKNMPARGMSFFLSDLVGINPFKPLGSAASFFAPPSTLTATDNASEPGCVNGNRNSNGIKNCDRDDDGDGSGDNCGAAKTQSNRRGMTCLEMSHGGAGEDLLENGRGVHMSDKPRMTWRSVLYLHLHRERT